MNDVIKGTLLLLLAIVGSLVVVSGALTLLPGVASPVKDAAGIVQALAAVAAVVLGGVFAYRNSLLFRTFEPHLTITQAVTHRRIGTQYLHIAVTATPHNSSKVKVEIREGFFRLMQVSPVDDDAVEILYAQTFAYGERRDLQWPVLDEFRRPGRRNEVVIEPGESRQETCEFIAVMDTQTVIVYSYFYNAQFVEGSESAQGWSATTVYDIVVRK